MKIRNSLKSAKTRDKDCRLVRRKGRVYVINKKNPASKPAKAEAVFSLNAKPGRPSLPAFCSG